MITVSTPSRRADKRVIRAKADGICFTCGVSPVRPGRILCQPCADRGISRDMKRHDRFAVAGLCWVCGKVAPLKSLAEALPISGRVCEICYFKRCAYKNLRSRSYWITLRDKLVAQDHRCAYTGILLELGVNDSLDHILPSSRYPERSNDKDNVEWVCRSVNGMKRDRTPDEFIASLQQIIDYRKRSRL